MSITRLVRLRRWLPLDEAADYLRSELGVQVSALEVLRLAIDRHLPLSLYLPVGTKATEYGIEVKGIEQPRGRTTRIEGLWTVVMDSIARQQLEHDYEFSANRNYIDIGEIGGASVKSGACRFQLEPQGSRSGLSTRPRSAFPEGSVMAVGTAALDAFISAYWKLTPQGSSPAQDKPPAESALGERERTTLLTLIAALCHHAGIDIAKPSAAGTTIEAMTQGLGTRVSARTIEEHLKKIPDAIERRAKTSS